MNLSPMNETKQRFFELSIEILENFKNENECDPHEILHSDQIKKLSTELNSLLGRIEKFEECTDVNHIQRIFNQITHLQNLPKEKLTHTQLEIDMEKGLSGQPLPACKRLALFICLHRAGDIWNDISWMAFHNPILTSVITDERDFGPLTLYERSLIYDEFLNFFHQNIKKNYPLKMDRTYTFEEYNSFNFEWYIDYDPPLNLKNIMSRGLDKIKEWRSENNGPELRSFFGLGTKCTYSVKNGAALFDHKFITHQATLINNPWKRFYKTEDSIDEKIALEHCPNVPVKIKNKLFHRNIVRTMNYTMRDAFKVYSNNNIGLTQYLIETNENSFSFEIGYQILELAIHYHDIETILLLYEKGLPFYHEEKGYLFLFQIISEFNPYLLRKFLNKCKLKTFYLEDFKDLTNALYFRYLIYSLDSYEELNFKKLKEFWISAHNNISISLEELSFQFYERILENENIYQVNINDSFAEFFRKKFIKHKREITRNEFDHEKEVSPPFHSLIERNKNNNLLSEKMINDMKFTLNLNIHDLIDSNNLGILKRLILKEKAHLTFNSLDSIYTLAEKQGKWSICFLCFKLGLSILQYKNKFTSKFKTVFKHCDESILIKIFNFLIKKNLNNSLLTDLIEYYVERLTYDDFKPKTFNAFKEFWIKSYISKKTFYLIEDVESKFYEKMIFYFINSENTNESFVKKLEKTLHKKSHS